MKKLVYIVIAFCLLGTHTYAEELCFLAKEGDKTLKTEGDCEKRFTPQSTFKLPLALMGFDAHILKDIHNPVFVPKEGESFYINCHKGPHDPRTWMRDSCVWYSQDITRRLGIEKFAQYIKKFAYGNMDISGHKGKNDGLTHAWLSSSLEISTEEQVLLLQNILAGKLDISQNAFEMTKSILFLQELHGGWKLYGKTGSGSQFNEKGEETALQHGWFVGWIERGNRKIVFATHITDSEKKDVAASFRARNETLNKLFYLTNALE